MSARPRVPVILTIAGSDNSGGAGLQADLKTITTLGGYGATAVTCIVAEHPGRVVKITPVAADQVRRQIDLVFEAMPVAAIKTGMLYSAAIIRAVVEALAALGRKRPPLVVDPVMLATVGTSLMEPTAEKVLRQQLLPMATCVTPNADEAMRLLKKPIRSINDLKSAAIELESIFESSFIVKGGHLKLPQSVDILCQKGRVRAYSVKTIPDANPHGTGCTFSAAIATRLGFGDSLPEAVAVGKRFITRAIKNRLRLGPYDLLYQLPERAWK